MNSKTSEAQLLLKDVDVARWYVKIKPVSKIFLTLSYIHVIYFVSFIDLVDCLSVLEEKKEQNRASNQNLKDIFMHKKEPLL